MANNAPRVSPPQRLPAVYHNIQSVMRFIPFIPTRGRVIAMFPQDWYTPNQLTEIHAREWLSTENPVDALAKMGMASTPDFHPANLGMNAMLSGGTADGKSDGASIAFIFPQNTGGEKAGAIQAGTESAIEWEAAKHGTAGNKINISILARDGAFEVVTFFNETIVGRQTVESLHELQPNRFVVPKFTLPDDFDPDADDYEPIPLPLGQITLSGGSSGAVPAYSERQGAFQNAASAMPYWDVIAFSIAPDDANYTAATNSHKAWLDQLNSDPPQRSRKSFMWRPVGASSDNSNVYNISDTCSFDGVLMTPSQMVLWLAGLSAGAAGNVDLTASVLRRATDLRLPPGQETQRTAPQRTAAINTGFLILEQESDGSITIVREINSFVRTRLNKTIQWTDGKTGRVRDLWMQAVNHKFKRHFKGQVDDTADERENFQIALSDLAMLFQDQRMIYQHDISKISVVSEPNAFKTWRSSYIPMIIPGTIDTLDMITRIDF